MHQVFRACGQHEGKGQRTRRRDRGLHTGDCEFHRIDRIIHSPGGVFDRTSHETHLRRETDGLCAVLWIVTETVLEIGRNRQHRRFYDGSSVIEGLLPAHRSRCIGRPREKAKPALVVASAS
jgi:hypothetical protein